MEKSETMKRYEAEIWDDTEHEEGPEDPDQYPYKESNV